jgi:hypothetical protein
VQTTIIAATATGPGLTVDLTLPLSLEENYLFVNQNNQQRLIQ